MLLTFIFFLVAQDGFYTQQGHVNDYMHVLEAKNKMQLERELSSLEKKDGIAFVVVVVPDLNNQRLEELSLQFFSRWQISSKQRDSGILLIISPSGSYIDLGYGLDDLISVGQAREICQNVINPLLAQNKTALAVQKGVEAVFGKIGVTFTDDESSGARSIYTSPAAILFYLSIPLLLLVARFAPTNLFYLSPLIGFLVGITQSFGLAIVLFVLGVLMVVICYFLKTKLPPNR